LIQREDDKEATVRNRLAVYHEQTKPLVSFYEDLESKGTGVKVIKVNGVASVDNIRADISTALG